MPLFAVCIHVVRVFPLILYIVFHNVLCHYLLLCIHVVRVFSVNLIHGFCHCIVSLFVVNSFACYIRTLDCNIDSDSDSDSVLYLCV